jgi:hypothetical protein
MTIAGDPETNTDTNLFIARFKNWKTRPDHFECKGKWIREICIFGIGDLPLLAQRPEMFANKFNSDFHPLAYDCMEEMHYNRTRADLLGNRVFDDARYKRLDFVKNHV